MHSWVQAADGRAWGSEDTGMRDDSLELKRHGLRRLLGGGLRDGPRSCCRRSPKAAVLPKSIEEIQGPRKQEST